MRYFNITGPCRPDEHYTVRREALLAVGREMVEQGRYFTIFAPRQTGKTTFFQLLMEELRQEPAGIVPIWISLEGMHTLEKGRFYEAFTSDLVYTLKGIGIHTNAAFIDSALLRSFFMEIRQQSDVRLALIIDEFEGIPPQLVSEVVHTFRKLYHRKDEHALHSLILVGISTLVELITGPASPFNIAEQLQISYFSREETEALIDQYVAESGQPFEAEVRRAIYENSAGQPGLTCALCKQLVEVVATDRSQAVNMAHFYRTLKHFLTERFDLNIMNIVQKARQKQGFMLKALFGMEPIPFTVHDPDIAFLYAHGVVTNRNGQVDVVVPLYSKVLIMTFRPLINGEAEHYLTSAHERVGDYVKAGELDVKALLLKYDAYVKRRGFQAFDTTHLREGAWHYSLDGFLYFFIERLGGQTFVEAPSGRGRTDILILLNQRKYVIETKIYTDASYFEDGKRQLAAYLAAEDLDAGYYVVFSGKHSARDTLNQEEIVDGKTICTFIIRTNFEPPSRRRARGMKSKAREA